MYRITIDFDSQVSFIDRPQFDSIMAYAYLRDLDIDMVQRLSYTEEQLHDISGMPILKDNNGLFLASSMFYDESEHIESKTTYYSRWNSKHDSIVKFRKEAKVDTSRGAYKSHTIPLVIHYIKKAWFFFESDNPEEVGRLFEDHIVGIGKKRGSGKGTWKSFDIQPEANLRFDSDILRPIPKELVTAQQTSGALKSSRRLSFKHHGFKPPYWLDAHKTECVVPI